MGNIRKTNIMQAKMSCRDLMQSYEKPSNLPPPIGLALWNFSSQWFLVPQGLGIVAVILHQLDYQFDGLFIISVVIWLYTITLLAVGVFLYLLRIFLYPRHVASALKTSITETSCLASISITFTSIIIMAAVVLVRKWGSAWGIVVYVLWWINTAMAVGSVMWIPYVYVKVQPPGLEAVAPGVLLPLISALTSAAGGSIICRYGALSDRLQIPVIIVSYLEVGVGLPLAVKRHLESNACRRVASNPRQQLGIQQSLEIMVKY
ncbi:hypothetical protein N7451_012154 [Penicillium sp. IBT 35674x]|nr:hypothetical protein N7451_012154 [Penicillium sp. IBT 35674x]